MDFDALRRFQDSLSHIGIGGNDCAVYVNGKPVYRHCTGWQDMKNQIPISENTLYQMFSMTKPVTCAAALQLLEQGAYLLDDPLSDYLPEYSSQQVLTVQPDGNPVLHPAVRPILVQQLFEMTAGLDYNMQTPSLCALYEREGAHFTTRQFAQALSQEPLRFEPGTHWNYSLAHDVLGALIEVCSGMTFGAYLQKNLFEPLGITAWFHLPASERHRLCGRYGFDESGKFVRGDEENHLQPGDCFESGGAGLTMTVGDYAKFACAMTNRGISADGARILAGRTVDLMRMPRLSQMALADFRGADERSGTRGGYSYGLGVRTLRNQELSGGLTAAGEFGWGGAWGTYVVMDPENRVTIVYAEQGIDTKAPYIQRRIRNIAYAALEWENLI